MAKKAVSGIEEIKKALKDKKAVIGSERTFKEIRKGSIVKVYLASNCSAETETNIGHYAKLQNIEVVKIKQPNDELGVLCKKPFLISVIGLLK